MVTKQHLIDTASEWQGYAAANHTASRPYMLLAETASSPIQRDALLIEAAYWQRLGSDAAKSARERLFLLIDGKHEEQSGPSIMDILFSEE